MTSLNASCRSEHYSNNLMITFSRTLGNILNEVFSVAHIMTHKYNIEKDKYASITL